MRALCGAIIVAGSLIGLGLTAEGIGNRYQTLSPVDREGQAAWLTFKTMDTPLTLIVVVLLASLIVGMAVAFIGLAYHHHRRHHEMLRYGQAPAAHAPGMPTSA